MSAALVLDLMRHAVTVTLMTAGPLLVTALLVGILVSFVQAITQIQEQTLTFVPKFAAIAIVGLLAAPWLLRTLVTFLTDMLRSLPALVGQ
jgi:flagellar biosynthesis protein FliQ